MASIDDPQVGYLEDGVTPVYQDRQTRFLYYLGPPVIRYVGSLNVNFLQCSNEPSPQQPMPRRQVGIPYTGPVSGIPNDPRQPRR